MNAHRRIYAAATDLVIYIGADAGPGKLLKVYDMSTEQCSAYILGIDDYNALPGIRYVEQHRRVEDIDQAAAERMYAYENRKDLGDPPSLWRMI